MVVGLVVGVVASPGRWLATRRTRCAHALRPSQAAAQGLPVARLVLMLVWLVSRLTAGQSLGFSSAKRISLTTAPRRPGYRWRRSLVGWLRAYRSSSKMRAGMR